MSGKNAARGNICGILLQEERLSIVYNEITLRNALDVGDARHGRIKEHEIRQITVQALVDTGAGTVVINEEIRAKLGLDITGSRPGTLADGAKYSYNLAGPVEVVWKDRFTTCDAIVLPNANEVLLGAIPLEGMDLTINPKRELVGVHGDEILQRIT